jgi:uncharacterized protein
MTNERRIAFTCGGENLVGLFWLPEGPSPHPALIFEGPLTSVKEQVTGHYARAMARRGFLTLSFDHRHFGESGGEPRQFESPPRKVEDLRAAVAYLGSLPEVDAARIGAVGVCAGAGYLARAVAEEPRIRAWGAVAGFFHDAGKQREWMGEEAYASALERARKARAAFEAGAEVETIPAVGEGDVAMPLKEAFEYYGTPRGAVANYRNSFAVLSREETLPWDAQGAAARIDQPTLVIHSEKALAPALARNFFANLSGPKEEAWVTSKGQIDFYDDPAITEPAAERLAEHFRMHLA